LRKIVDTYDLPENLRALVPKHEFKRSLRTKDQQEAKFRFAQANAELEARWAELRKGLRAISEREAHEIGREFYEMFLARRSENPSRHNWNQSQGVMFERHDRFAPNLLAILITPPKESPFRSSPAEEQHRLIRLCDDEVAAYLQKSGLIVDQQSRENLIRTAGRAFQRASLLLDEIARGYLSNGERTAQSDRTGTGQRGAPPNKSVHFAELLQSWANERMPAKKTAYTWKIAFTELAAFLGHDDAGAVATEDIIRWKDSMIEGGLAAKTVRDGKIAPIRAVLQWAVDNRRISANPTAGVAINARTKPGKKIRGFEESEALLILTAAAKSADAAKRWIPWLCAYSGARVSEISQLRKMDVIQTDGIWCIQIVADAGSVKNANSERIVPLHSALLEIGFLKFIETLPEGPLFSHVGPDRFGNRGGNVSKRICFWVRSLGVDDERLSPNHSWRHRLKTLARRHDLALDLVNAVMGHARKDVAAAYGEYPISSLKREIEKLPLITV
jgi:integrase